MHGIECAATGRLGQDAELRLVKGGELPLLSFGLAVDEGEQRDRDAPTTWLRVAVFGEKAEELAPRLLKGKRVYVEGRLRLELFEGRDGQTRSALKVTATTVQPLGQIGKRRPRQATQRRAQAHQGNGGRDWQAPGDDGVPFDDPLPF